VSADSTTLLSADTVLKGAAGRSIELALSRLPEESAGAWHPWRAFPFLEPDRLRANFSAPPTCTLGL
jgi:hypothetical protein